MRLLIVESPNKVKKIQGFLGDGWRVAASVGHIRDLPKDALGFAIEGQRIVSSYVNQGDKVGRLRALANKAESIFLATDPDREGEAIAWHLQQVLGRKPTYHRVAFHEITKTAVQTAVAAPGQVDLALVGAQQARRILDRAVGWFVSPTVSSALGKEARSAGRVQTPALRLVVDREREIAAFQSVTYLVPEAVLSPPGIDQSFTAKLCELNGAPLAHTLTDPQQATTLLERLRPGPWSVAELTTKPRTVNPPAPFTTSTAQQAASVSLKWTPKATMAALQKLFEEGHITYHRTDSVALSEESVTALRAVIEQEFGADLLPDAPRVFATKDANAQEAHEAIRPTHPETGPDIVAGDLGRLYRLIWQRTVASQMQAGLDDVTTVTVATASEPAALFRTKGIITRTVGWRQLTAKGADDESSKDDDEQGPLPPFTSGQDLVLNELLARQKKTKPAARFTQASLIKTLEAKGVGRPSTFASIVDLILARGYVVDEKRKLRATDLGCRLIDWVVVHYAGDFVEIDYTARLEAQLDAMAAGTQPWEPGTVTVVQGLLERAKAAGLKRDPFAAAAGPEIAEGVLCPACDGPMRLVEAPKGSFYGCLKKTCRATRNLDGSTAILPGVSCPLCKKPMRKMTRKASDSDSPSPGFAGCTGYPTCRGTRPLDADGNVVAPVIVTDHHCPLCHEAAMQQRSGQYGPFLACTTVHRKKLCKGMLNEDGTVGPKHFPLHSEQRCEKCGAKAVVVTAARGPFLACYKRTCKWTMPLPD